MKQESANHQSNKETLKFNGQFVHACFNLVFFFFFKMETMLTWSK